MITYRLITRDELRPAIRFVLSQPGFDDLLDERVQALEAYAARMGLSLSRQWAAFEHGVMVACCLCVAARGRTAMLFLPGGNPVSTRTTAELLRHIVQDAFERDIRIVQTLLTPTADREEAIVREAGLWLLAELIYMQRPADEKFPNAPAATGLSWLSYTPERHSLFAETVAGTYEASLDCPGLAGLRTIEDILDSHRAAGEFDSRHWLIVMQDGEPAGALLMARLPGRDVLDVVYMGLLPRFRGRGLGRAVLHQAVKLTRDAACRWTTLAVDASNPPALRSYGSCGFTETARRRAWIIAANANIKT